MMKRLTNQRGVALILVLGSILILSTIIVELAYNTHVSYELASTERDRLRSYYLARSALNLSRLELKFEKNLRDDPKLKNALQGAQGTGITADPFCKQIPLSTQLLRGISSGALEKLLAGKTEEETGEEKPEEPAEAKAPLPERAEPVEGAEEFLSFDGDFEALCDPEERKINLNIFARPNPAAAPAGGAGAGGAGGAAGGGTSLYDSQKILLVSLLSQKEFEEIFKGKPDEIRKLVTRIADWADRDDRINEEGGIAGGLEDSEYEDSPYKVKNGKYTTVSDLLLIPGIGDDLFKLLAPHVTVYGESGKLNLCQASEELVRAFVLGFIQTSALGIAPISETDDTKWQQITDAVQTACAELSPTPQAVATAIGGVIGAPNTQALASQIVTTNRFYRFDAVGTVGDSTTRISTVIDANQGKILYFRVE